MHRPEQVEFLPTCAPRFAEGSSGDEDVTEVSRLLERVLKESRCLDMESLCIIAEESVWCVRLDIHVLNHAGNVADVAGIAGLAALSHFRRPDATVVDGKVRGFLSITLNRLGGLDFRTRKIFFYCQGLKAGLV